MPFKPGDAALPLTPISFEILLALLDGDRHGYAILQAVEARLARVLPLRTGTMYRALARLLEEGLIVKTDGGEVVDERRQNYRITPRGRQVARAEAERLADQVEAARARRLLPGTRR
jgi:DNA-binding PadR family transcriptional regulator